MVYKVVVGWVGGIRYGCEIALKGELSALNPAHFSVSQQDPKVHKAGGQRAPLWQRWESGQVNGQPSEENN